MQCGGEAEKRIKKGGDQENGEAWVMKKAEQWPNVGGKENIQALDAYWNQTRYRGGR